MKKPRRQKLKRNGTTPNRPLPEEKGRPQQQGWRRGLERFVDFVEAKRELPIVRVVSLLFVFVGSLAGIVQTIRQMVAEPVIEFESIADPSDPLSTPFAVKNGSWLFEMTNAQPICGFSSLRAGNALIMSLRFSAPVESIPRRETVSFRCRPSDTFPIPTRIDQARMDLTVRYTTFWFFKRESRPIDFTWYTKTNPPRWIRGRIAE
jgi:hypothetical protein